MLICIAGFSQFQFENRYSGQNGTDAKSIRQTLDTGYIVVGGQSQPSSVMTIMKLNQMGDTIWTTDFDDPPAFGFNVEQCLDSGYIVTGYVFDPSNKAILVKLDPFGSIEWSQTYTESNWGQAVKQLPDSSFIVAGQRIFKTDRLGSVLWSQATETGNQAMSMIMTSDGNLVYTQTSSSLSSGTWLTKMDTDGNTIWTESYSNLYTHSNCDNNVDETSDGGFIISGQPNDDNSGMLMKLDSDRDVEWTKEFQSGTLGAATSVVESDSGDFLACGYRVDANGIHAYVHRVDVDGNMLWNKEYEKGQLQSLITTMDGGYAFAGYRENNSGKQKYFVAKIGGQQPTYIQEVSKNTFSVFPTMSSGLFHVKCNSCIGDDVSIIDLNGKIIEQRTLTTEVNLGRFPVGSYFIVNKTSGESTFIEIIR